MKEFKYDYSTVKNHLLYKIFRPVVLWPYTTLFYTIKYVGLENVPKDGGFIIAANHTSFNDPLFVARITKRPVHFMAKQEIYKNSLFNAVLVGLNSFPVTRDSKDMEAIGYGTKIINQGQIMGIFPEGTRNLETYKPTRPKAGVSLIAKQTGADVLPVAIYSNGKIKPYKKCTIRVGKIIKNEELGFSPEGKPSELKFATKLIFDRITGLWEEGHCE